MENYKPEIGTSDKKQNKMSKTSKVLVGTTVGALAFGAAMPAEANGEVVQKDTQEKNSHELVIGSKQDRETAKEMVQEALENPGNLKDIIIKYAWRKAKDKLEVRHIMATIQDFNDTSSLLGLEDQKKLRGLYNLIGEFGKLPVGQVIGGRETRDMNSQEEKNKSDELRAKNQERLMKERMDQIRKRLNK